MIKKYFDDAKLDAIEQVNAQLTRFREVHQMGKLKVHYICLRTHTQKNECLHFWLWSENDMLLLADHSKRSGHRHSYANYHILKNADPKARKACAVKRSISKSG